jgi:hypothetical protein
MFIYFSPNQFAILAIFINRNPFKPIFSSQSHQIHLRSLISYPASYFLEWPVDINDPNIFSFVFNNAIKSNWYSQICSALSYNHYPIDLKR